MCIATKDLVLVGGGGHCKSVIDVAESAGYNILGILDRQEKVGKQIVGYDVIGTDKDISRYLNKADFIITVGFIDTPIIRIRIYDKIKESGGMLATVIASTAHVSRYATIGAGTVIMHNATVNAGAQIGINCIINTGSNIEHDVVIGNQCHISTGAMINGDCRIGTRTFIGSQTVLCNGLTIGKNVIIGAGSVVVKDIPDNVVAFGNPCQIIRKTNENNIMNVNNLQTITRGGVICKPVLVSYNLNFIGYAA